MWVEGTANGTYLRRSLKTASWERATELSRIIEDSDKPAESPERKDEPVTIVQAVTEYLADAKARELADATLYKLEIQLRKQFLGWCKAEGYKLLKEFDLRAAQAFRAFWTDGGLAKKKQERLTGFFWFCIRAGWLTANPTDRLGRISVTQAPTDYFTRDEYDKLLDATQLYRQGRGEEIGETNGTRIRALIMLMRWSGLRIRDAVTLERITQSGLSRRVASLEKRYRITLFKREHANVVLTEPGRVFVEEAKLSLMHNERAIEVAKAVAEGAESVLHIGRSPYADPFLTSTLLSIHSLFIRICISISTASFRQN